MITKHSKLRSRREERKKKTQGQGGETVEPKNQRQQGQGGETVEPKNKRQRERD